MKRSKQRIACTLATGLALLGGCATQPHRVSCDQHLEPINSPAPKVAEAQDKKPGQKGSSTGQVAP